MDSDVWTSLAYTWGPIILMLGFFVFFSRKVGTFRYARNTERSFEYMEQQQKLLERIATALEQRNARG